MNPLTQKDFGLQALRAWTDARIALGTVGASTPTAATLEFAADHAAARDAVHTAMDFAGLARQLEAAGFQTMFVRSQAESRAAYLRRPDLGRRLDAASADRLRTVGEAEAARLTVVVGDGLSAEAPTRYAAPLLIELRERLTDWTLDTVVLADQARVALGDGIGELRRAEAVLMLLGERPGLRAADSLGAYLTYAPHTGRSDATRNCVSNIREGGLGIVPAVTKLVYLLRGARALGQSGVSLKDNSELPPLEGADALGNKNAWKGLLEANAELLER